MMKHLVVTGTLLITLAKYGHAAGPEFVVSNLNSSGSGSLAQAVLNANASAGADEIIFASGLTGTITPDAMTITDALIITGPGADKITVSGSDAARIFAVVPSGGVKNITIKGLTLAHGSAGQGGAIFVNGLANVTLQDLVFTDNTAPSGGAVSLFVDTNTTTVFRNCTFTNNQAGNRGGAIYAESGDSTATLTIETSVFDNNEALTGSGGAVAIEMKGTATIAKSRFVNNTSSTDGGALSTLGTVELNLTITQTTFATNTAGNAGGAARIATSPLTVFGSTFSGNQASTTGALLLSDVVTGPIRISNTTIHGNTATGSGAVLTSNNGDIAFDHVTITDNTGGGIVVGGDAVSASVKIGNSVIFGNLPQASFDVGGFAGRRADIAYSIVGKRDTIVTETVGAIHVPDPLLRPLAIYANGMVATRPPQVGSDATDSGDPLFDGTGITDALGAARVQGTRTDMGAVELPPCGFDGDACNDANTCTTNDTCAAGVCVGTPSTEADCVDTGADDPVDLIENVDEDPNCASMRGANPMWFLVAALGLWTRRRVGAS